MFMTQVTMAAHGMSLKTEFHIAEISTMKISLLPKCAGSAEVDPQMVNATIGAETVATVLEMPAHTMQIGQISAESLTTKISTPFWTAVNAVAETVKDTTALTMMTSHKI
jgi:hypothetical protein